MSDWEVVEPATEDKPGKVRRARVYALKPGMAHVYNEGDVHSPKRVTTTGLIRIEGKNTQKMKRLPYKAIWVISGLSKSILEALKGLIR
jgi:hypothetical protein